MELVRAGKKLSVSLLWAMLSELSRGLIPLAIPVIEFQSRFLVVLFCFVFDQKREENGK